MLSIVVPVFNEEESLQAFYAELLRVVPGLTKSFEVIFVDDGSTDASLDLLQNLAKKDQHLRIFSFRKNRGKAEALTFGFQAAKGDLIVTLDADLQDKPSEIGKLLVKQKEGFDLVSGWRKNRQDSVKKKLFSKLSNSLLSFLWGNKLHDYNCGLKLYTKEAAKSLNLYGGMHRFIPLLVIDEGFRVTELPVEHEARKFGKSKYSFAKFLKDLPDLFTIIFLTKYAKKPLHFFASAGGILFAIGFITFLYLWIFIQIMGHHAIGRRPLFFVSLIMMLAGLQVFFTGFLADIILHVANNFQTNSKDNQTVLLKYSTD